MDLAVEGRHALLFDDDATAAFVGSSSALLPWSADPTLLLDRYDARHLLDRVPPRPARRRRSDPDDADLDLERYLDLPPPSPDAADEDSAPAQEAKKGLEVANYQAVPFSYGNVDVSVASSPNESTTAAFSPPFPVPENLVSNLPSTEKLHQIIARTAIFVSEHGGQSEIVLRVKQGDNPTFGFLMPDHYLHPYFRYLVDHPQVLKADTKSASSQQEKNLGTQENESCAVQGGALSLLESVYGSGEDDDGLLQDEPAKLGSHNVDVDVQTEKSRSSTTAVLDERTVIKDPLSAAVKEKKVASRQSLAVNSGSKSAASRKKVGDETLLGSQSGRFGDNRLIVEPPSFLKRMVGKIVDLVVRNGKDFETVLTEQDKAIGRLPFLLPSNQYHAYYLKILEEAREGHAGSKRKVQAALSKESAPYGQISAEQYEGWSYDPHRREKFKMFIGGPKKDSHDHSSRPVRQSGVSAGEAAAIVLAATRGVSPSNARGLSDTGLARSGGSLSSSQGHNRIPRPASNGEAGDSGSIEKQIREGVEKTDDVLVAKAIAKTAALAASSEADSSEAGLTKEEKLKAERLKRAKLFAAMIKSRGQNVSELVRSGSLEATAGGHTLPVSEPDVMSKEREGSSVPSDIKTSSRVQSPEEDYVHYNHHSERKYRKRHHSRPRDHEEDSTDNHKHSKTHSHNEVETEEHKHSRKKHRSEHISRYEEESSEEEHKHSRRKRHSEHSSRHEEDSHKHRHPSRDDESRHRHHHRSSSDDEHKHRKSSRSRHRHKRDHQSDDEDQEGKRTDKHRKKAESERKRKEEVTDDATISNHSDEVASLNTYQGVGAAAVADAQPSNTVEVPEELRAKIRAMLLETM